MLLVNVAMLVDADKENVPQIVNDMLKDHKRVIDSNGMANSNRTKDGQPAALIDYEISPLLVHARTETFAYQDGQAFEHIELEPA